MNVKRTIVFCLAAIGLMFATGCGGADRRGPHEYVERPRAAQRDADQMVMERGEAESVSLAAESFAAPSAPPSPGKTARPSAADLHAFRGEEIGSAGSAQGERAAKASLPEVEDVPDRGQLLIYSGGLVVAIYEVEETQDKAIALVEEMGGYVSTRTSNSLIARVPAPKFRDAMDALAELGDTLDRSWKAQDVSEEVRDLDIRLRNLLGLRDRLVILLEKVETIEEALKIEAELERITLEIERIRGQLKSFEDRIAYSTIEVSFRAKGGEDVPKEDFLLPFKWLNTLGLKSLLRSPRMYR